MRPADRERVDPKLYRQYQLLDTLLHNYGQLVQLQQVNKSHII